MRAPTIGKLIGDTTLRDVFIGLIFITCLVALFYGGRLSTSSQSSIAWIIITVVGAAVGFFVLYFMFLRKQKKRKLSGSIGVGR